MEVTKKIEKSLEYSIMHGILTAISLNLVNAYFTPFILAIGFSAREVALINSIMLVSSAIGLITGAFLMKKINKKKIVVVGVFLQAINIMGIYIIATTIKEKTLVMLASAIWFFLSSIPSTAWTKWMKELTRDVEKGKFFGRRNTLTGIFGFLSYIIGGIILQIFSKINIIYGFLILFATGSVARALAAYFLNKKVEISKKVQSKLYFYETITTKEFLPIMVFISFLVFSSNLASPFFAVHALKRLKLEYIQYTFIFALGSIAGFLFQTTWGNYIDTLKKDKIILAASSFFIAITPLGWMLFEDPLILGIFEFFSGASWAGFWLSSFTLILSKMDEEKVSTARLVFDLVLKFSAFLGTTTIYLIYPYLTKLGFFKYDTQYSFLLSFVGRSLATAYIFYIVLNKKEREEAKKITVYFTKDLFLVPLGITKEITSATIKTTATSIKKSVYMGKSVIIKTKNFTKSARDKVKKIIPNKNKKEKSRHD